MANILFSAFSNVTWTKEKYLDSFVEGFTRSLARCGNRVLNIRTNDFVMHPVVSNAKLFIDKISLLNEIKAFKPDLIITFNNSLPFSEVITETSCPIALYVADGTDFFAFPELINQHLERYSFFNLNESIYQTLLKSYPDIKESQFFDFGYATDFRARNIDQDINVSFLGSIPNYAGSLIRHIQQAKSNEVKDHFFEEFDKFRQDVHGRLNATLPGFHDNVSLETLAIFLLTTKSRFFTLSALTDLGLVIKGYETFCDAGAYDYDILRAYNFDLCVSIDQSEDFFNRSKISLNLPNARATVGFSWRVPDVLSSNSVLLAPKKHDLNTLMQGYAELPMYESPQEARELAIKLLKDDVWRKELTQASQRMVEDKCRFDKKFKVMEKHFNLNLTNNPAALPVEHLDPGNFLVENIIRLQDRIKPYVPATIKQYLKKYLIRPQRKQA